MSDSNNSHNNDAYDNYWAGRLDGAASRVASSREQEWNADYRRGREEAEAQNKRDSNR